MVASIERVCDISLSGIKYASLLNSSRYFHFAENFIFERLKLDDSKIFVAATGDRNLVGFVQSLDHSNHIEFEHNVS